LQTKEENGISVGVQTEHEELDKPADRDKPADTSNGKKMHLISLWGDCFTISFFDITLIP
jgi:hypothetical protein